MKQVKLGMSARFPGWKGSNRSNSKGEGYNTKSVVYRVKFKDGYVSFGSAKAMAKFVRKVKNAAAKEKVKADRKKILDAAKR